MLLKQACTVPLLHVCLTEIHSDSQAIADISRNFFKENLLS